MQNTEYLAPNTIGRIIGWSLLGSIVVGIIASLTLAKGIDVNLSADIAGTAQAMLEAEAETRLRGKAYAGVFTFGLQVLISLGLFELLRRHGPLLAGWSLLISLAATILVLLGSVFAINAAVIASDPVFASAAERLSLASLQAASDHTSFHLGLVLSSAGMAGFFYLFLKSGLIPKIIAGWGVFSSVFVAIAIVARDFIPALGHNAVTGAFMLSNLIALVALGFYLVMRGVRTVAD